MSLINDPFMPADDRHGNEVIEHFQSRLTAAETRVKELEKALRFYSNPDDWTQCEAMTDVGDRIKQGEPMMVFEPGEDHPWSIAADALRAELDKLKGKS